MAPYSGDRQPLVRPTASTIVRASTDSTADPRNAAAPNVRIWAYTCSNELKELEPEMPAPALGFNGPMKPGLYSDDSITRRVNRENVLFLGGGRALLMQLAHPKVAAGVERALGLPDPIRSAACAGRF